MSRFVRKIESRRKVRKVRADEDRDFDLAILETKTIHGIAEKDILDGDDIFTDDDFKDPSEYTYLKEKLVEYGIEDINPPPPQHDAIEQEVEPPPPAHEQERPQRCRTSCKCTTTPSSSPISSPSSTDTPSPPPMPPHQPAIDAIAPDASAEELNSKSKEGCCSATGPSICPLFRNGGDLGGFERNGWVPMPCPMVIDSGAAETVLPLSWFQSHSITETEASRSGVYYTTANGEKVYNKGEKTLTMCHFEGSEQRNMTFQCANVHKALGSANKIVRNGNRIVMDVDDDGNDYSYIESKTTGERLWLREREGVYVLDMLIAPPAGQNGVSAATTAPGHPPESGFSGQGR